MLLSVHGSAATWAAPSGLHTTQRCNAIWVEWAVLSSFQRAGCSALGSMMTEWPVAVNEVSDNRCIGLVSLEV